jgi:iron complex outermembrane recepter protein
MKKNQHLFLTFMLTLLSLAGWSQTGIKGTVKDAGGSPIIGASVAVSPGNQGTITDLDGNFEIALSPGKYTVIYTYTGYKTMESVVEVGSDMLTADASLEEGLALSDVTIVGTRTAARSNTSSPLPIDVFTTKDLRSTGQTTFDKALQYRVPSFNTVNTPVNDATTLLDPYEIRNMGPARTLILINGKRKNTSSLLYVQFAPGRGETGADLSAIPQDAIKRVEILRDGASAQYGSDAIAGVMNVILKDRYEYSSLNLNAGVTSAGDGSSYGLSYNGGANASGKGFLNYTLGLNQQNNAIRSGNIHIPTEIATFGGDPVSDANIKKYLAKFPTGNNLNGTGERTAAQFLINGGIDIGGNTQLYGNAAYVVKSVLSNANYRTPYWRTDSGLLERTGTNNENYVGDGKNPLYNNYLGYMPTFEGDLNDYNATMGVKNEINGWQSDASVTFGGNTQSYTVNNTVNRGFGVNSPTRFKPGGYDFSHIVGNFDITKALSDKFSIAFGTEARSEKYSLIAGDTASFKSEGSNSFPGIATDNATTNTRFNLGFYTDLSYDITKDFLINAAARTEKYSDFGSANVWKLSSRYKLANDKVTVRGSLSTGFRAPTLHQIYQQTTQAAFVGGTIQLSGLFNNLSKQARLLGIPKLKPEKSNNITLGLGLNPGSNTSITLDYFKIDVKDRIVYSSSISSSDASSTLGQILSTNGVKTIQFFINGIETSTSGIDFVVNHRNIGLGSGKLNLNLAGNVMLNNEIIGAPAEPEAIKKAGSSILNAQIRSLLTESRPEYKVILGFDYSVGKFGVNLNNTLFGPTRFQDLDNGGSIMNDITAEFKPAVVTDLNLTYMISDKVTFNIGANNLLNVLPQWDLIPLNAKGTAAIAKAEDKALLRGNLGFSGRYDILGYNGSQFSQLGTILNTSLNIRF